MSHESNRGSVPTDAMTRSPVSRRGDPTAMFSGILFIGLGLGFFLIGLDYDFGTARRMGAGYFPMVLAATLVLLGVIVAIPGFSRNGIGLGSTNWRGMILIPLATLTFALLVRPAGMLTASFVSVCLASVSTPHYKPLNVLLVAAAISVFSTLVFVVGLGLPIPIVGYWFN